MKFIQRDDETLQPVFEPGHAERLESECKRRLDNYDNDADYDFALRQALPEIIRDNPGIPPAAAAVAHFECLRQENEKHGRWQSVAEFFMLRALEQRAAFQAEAARRRG